MRISRLNSTRLKDIFLTTENHRSAKKGWSKLVKRSFTIIYAVILLMGSVLSTELESSLVLVESTELYMLERKVHKSWS